jgi:hypothetical protein
MDPSFLTAEWIEASCQLQALDTLFSRKESQVPVGWEPGSGFYEVITINI